MYKIIFPTRDTTLYQRHPSRNTGVDAILELTKITSGSAVDALIGENVYWGETTNTRILIDFDFTAVSQSISSLGISNPEFYLKITSTEATRIPISYTVYAYPISGSWVNGTGFYSDDAQVTNGASWVYPDGAVSGREWSSYGGDYYTSSVASQLFDYESPDLRMNITPIVREWLSGSVDQNGLILKFSDAAETDSSDMGSIKFFSKDTHTIYVPRVEVFWDDVDVSGTGSVAEISSDDYSIYVKNLRDSYREGEVVKLRIGVRDSFPTRTYTNSAPYLATNRLPFYSYFQIMDSVTDEVIVPFDRGTRISCDSTGNYILVDMNNFMPERYYRILFKVSDGVSTQILDDNHAFKVYRK